MSACADFPLSVFLQAIITLAPTVKQTGIKILIYVSTLWTHIFISILNDDKLIKPHSLNNMIFLFSEF